MTDWATGLWQLPIVFNVFKTNLRYTLPERDSQVRHQVTILKINYFDVKTMKKIAQLAESRHIKLGGCRSNPNLVIFSLFITVNYFKLYQVSFPCGWFTTWDIHMVLPHTSLSFTSKLQSFQILHSSKHLHILRDPCAVRPVSREFFKLIRVDED